ncbi:MAG: cardiolipin synthase [Candidatus Eremiobacteraeota bacterium]|nr:cardiolipin synthase [Candidatus Eremiobacteraeota bacterium]
MDSQALRLSVLENTFVRRAQLQAVPARDHAVLAMPQAGIDSILDVIGGARQRVFVKMFKLTSERIQQALVAAAQRGVDVRVMLNPSRSDGSRANDEAAEVLRQGGVRVEWTNPSFYVTHEKSMVADELAFICTFNFADKYFKKTRGYAVVCRNQEEVAEVVEGFEADWERRPFTPRRLVWSQAAEGNSRRRLHNLIEGARQEILIENPKLVDQQITECLLTALKRGVRVCFLSSGLKGLSEWDVAENSANLRQLLAHGAQVREIKKPAMHAKLVLIDRKQALVGSMNLDRSCFELRRELGVVVSHPVPLADLLDTFQADWAASKPSHLTID